MSDTQETASKVYTRAGVKYVDNWALYRRISFKSPQQPEFFLYWWFCSLRFESEYLIRKGSATGRVFEDLDVDVEKVRAYLNNLEPVTEAMLARHIYWWISDNIPNLSPFLQSVEIEGYAEKCLYTPKRLER